MTLYEKINALLDAGKETWDSLLAKSARKAPDAAENPEKYRTNAERFVEAMRASRTALDAAKPLLEGDPALTARYNRLSAEYQGLKKKFLEAGGQGLEGWPLIVLGVAFSLAAIAWAVAMAPYAEGHRVQAQAFFEEVKARDAASREGRQLAPGTTPPPPPGPGIDWKIWAPIVGVIGAAVVGVALSKKG